MPARHILLLISAALTALALKANPPALPPTSQTITGYDNIPTVISHLSTLPLHHIEGIWKNPADGSLAVIERENPAHASLINPQPDTYRIVSLRHADRIIRPGTIIGRIVTTAKPRHYKANIYTHRHIDASKLWLPAKYLLQLDSDDNHIIMTRYGSKATLKAWLRTRLWQRISVAAYPTPPSSSSPTQLDGWVRVYPQPYPPIEPIYL